MFKWSGSEANVHKRMSCIAQVRSTPYFEVQPIRTNVWSFLRNLRRRRSNAATGSIDQLDRYIGDPASQFQRVQTVEWGTPKIQSSGISQVTDGVWVEPSKETFRCRLHLLPNLGSIKNQKSHHQPSFAIRNTPQRLRDCWLHNAICNWPVWSMINSQASNTPDHSCVLTSQISLLQGSQIWMLVTWVRCCPNQIDKNPEWFCGEIRTRYAHTHTRPSNASCSEPLSWAKAKVTPFNHFARIAASSEKKKSKVPW